MSILKHWYNRDTKILIFTETKRGSDRLCHELKRSGYLCNAIHGDKDQAQRDSALEDFRSGRVPLLIATDVASRGIDVKDIRLVINYDLPSNIEQYVHRVGRTGRKILDGFADGNAISFYDNSRDSRVVRDLVKILYESKQEIPKELESIVDSISGGRRRNYAYNSPRN